MNSPKVSIVIPCFNQGIYIAETIDCVRNQTYENIEVIVIDDGSTDPYTKDVLQSISERVDFLMHVENGGLAAARNKGIQRSSGKYILPLDADDLISNDYISQAVEILEGSSEFDVVCPDAELFGAEVGIWKMPELDINQLLKQNQFHCSSVFSREIYDRAGGYNTDMIYGYEDWDFWLSVYEAGGKFFTLNQPLFKYRIREQSMVRSIDSEKAIFLRRQIVENHQELYNKFFESPLVLYHDSRQLAFQLETIKKSKSFRLGRLVTWPFRRLYTWFT